MPADQRGWLDYHQSTAPFEQARELGQNESIGGGRCDGSFLALLE
jgi:hypothetical protein